jgi:phosphatidylinositol alpha-1,6-mannosyltransferase
MAGEHRVLLVTNDYPPRPGGIQQYLGNLVAVLGGDVLVAAPAHPGAEERAGVVRSRRRFMWPTRRIARWVDGLVADFRPDVVLFGAPYPLPWLGPALRHRHGVPYVVLAHGAEVLVPAAFPVSRQLLARPLKAADALVAVSRFTAGRLGKLTGRPVEVVGAGVDLDAFRPADLPTHNPTPVVGCVSRFVPRKGQHLLIEAAAKLRAAGTEVEVLLVGKGRLESRLRRLAVDLEVPLRMEVDAPWSELGGLYRQMDVFCMPCRSRWGGLEAEGLGLVLLEAAATGLPVLAGASGGAPETVEPGRTGFVVAGVEDIVEGLDLLLGDRERASRMGELGRQRIVEQFTWDRVADRLTSVFDEVVG